MPCLLLILGIAFPRVILAFLFFFTGYLIRPYHHGFLLPLLGFFFLPLTTLVYAVIINSGNTPDGLYLVALVVCAMADLGLIGGGVKSRNRR
jgi:UDP-N-acetylmuramyl pentapeptide phosphotransferase/UDP-N-acetylglucosamine-1-phosphate transferase